MPNVFKYAPGSTGPGVLIKGGFLIGNNTADYGGTFYSGITPSAGGSGGYTVYINKPSGGPSIYTPATDTDLVTITNQQVAGSMAAPASYTTANQALAYYAGETDKLCVNKEYPGIVTDGLVLALDSSYTPSYPKSTTTWRDLSGKSPDGTLVNGVAYGPSGGGILTFDGTDDYVSFSYDADVAFLGRAPYTLESVVNTQNSGAYPGYINREDSSTGSRDGYNLIYTTAGQAAGEVYVFSERFTSGTQRSVGSTQKTSSFFNRWHHVLSTYDGNDLRFYLDGTLLNTLGSTGSVTNSVKALEVGRRSAQYFSGGMQITRIYNKALSSSEILQNYFQAPIVTDGLALYLDAGNIVSYDGTSTSWYSMAGTTGATGSLFNGPTYSPGNGGVIVFDGTDDRVQLTTIPLPAGQTKYSMEAFWRASSIKTQVIYEQNSSTTATGQRGCMILLSNGLGGFNGQNADLHDVIPYTINTWYHWVITVDTTLSTNKIKIYVNGSLYTQGNPTFNAGTLNLGADLAGVGYKTNVFSEFFSGNVAITRVYNRVISPSEVLQNFNAQKSRFGF